jgi:hypothetical protein
MREHEMSANSGLGSTWERRAWRCASAAGACERQRTASEQPGGLQGWLARRLGRWRANRWEGRGSCRSYERSSRFLMITSATAPPTPTATAQARATVPAHVPPLTNAISTPTKTNTKETNHRRRNRSTCSSLAREARRSRTETRCLLSYRTAITTHIPASAKANTAGPTPPRAKAPPATMSEKITHQTCVAVTGILLITTD